MEINWNRFRRWRWLVRLSAWFVSGVVLWLCIRISTIEPAGRYGTIALLLCIVTGYALSLIGLAMLSSRLTR